MKWEVEYTDELGIWWEGLNEAEQESIAASVQLLEERGPDLGFPHTSSIHGSRYPHMRELRIQHQGRPYRISMHSTPGVSSSSSSGVTRQGTNVGTPPTFLSQTACTAYTLIP